MQSNIHTTHKALRTHLSLARASGRAASLGARGGSRGRAVGRARLAALAAGRGHGGDVVRVGKGSLGHAAQRLARGVLLGTLVVCGEVEGNEEDEVGRESRNAGQGGKLLAGALAGVGQEVEVGRGEVGVRGEVDET